MERMHPRNQPLHMILLAQKGDVPLHSELSGQRLRRPSIRAVSCHVQVGIDMPAHLFKSTDAVEDALDRPEIGDVHNAFLPSLGLLRTGTIQIAVDEVGDYLNGFGDAEE